MRNGLAGVLAAGALTLMASGCDKNNSSKETSGTSVVQSASRVNLRDAVYASSKMGGIEMTGFFYPPYVSMERGSDLAVEVGLRYDRSNKQVFMNTNGASLYLVFSTPIEGIGDAIPFSGPNLVNGVDPKIAQANCKRMVLKQEGSNRRDVLSIAQQDPVFGELFGSGSEVYKVAQGDGSLNTVYFSDGSTIRAGFSFRGHLKRGELADKNGLLIAAIADAQIEANDGSVKIRKSLCGVQSIGPRLPQAEGYWSAVGRTIDLWVDGGDYFLYLNRNGNPNRFEQVVFDKSKGTIYLKYPRGPKVCVKSDGLSSIDIGDGEIPLKRTRGLGF